MTKVNCENQNPKRAVDLSKIKKVADLVLSQLGKKKAEVNIVFVSNQKIRALHRRYLGIDTATDVLAFGYEAASGPAVHCTLCHVCRITSPSAGMGLLAA